MRKFGIGVDIENTARFERLDRQKNKIFFEKIYTEKEIKYCFSMANPSQHLAARFAGKEAVLKAINGLCGGNIAYEKIEITNNIQGAPSVKINYKNLKDLEVKLSLSHCNDKAIAFAIILQK